MSTLFINPASVPDSVPASVPDSVPASVPDSVPASVPDSVPVPAPAPVPTSAPASAPVPVASSTDTYSNEDVARRLREIMAGEEHYHWKDGIISLYFNDCFISDVIARVRVDGPLPQLTYRDIRTFLTKYLTPETLQHLGEKQDLEGWVSTKYLAEYRPEFNPESFDLRFLSHPETLATKDVYLSGFSQIDTSNAIRPNKYSAYLNFNHVCQTGESRPFYELDMEGAIRRGNWVLESEIDVNPEGDKVADYHNLKAIRDYPDRLTRLTIGETQSIHSRLLLGDRIQGVKYSSEFNLRPDYVSEPVSEFSFLLKRDSTVQIFVNGLEVYSLRQPAGPVDLHSVPLMLGANHVVLKITDDMGRVSYENFDNVKGPNLLAPGTTEFAYSLGVEGNGSNYSSDPVLSAFYRRGMTDTFTLSSEGQAKPDHQGIGGGFDWATPWFHTSGDIAFASSDFGKGMATRFIISRSFFRFQISGRYDYRSEDYFTHAETSTSSRFKYLAEISCIIPRVWKCGSLHMRATDIKKWIGADQRTAEVTWNYVFNNRWHLRLTALTSNKSNSDIQVSLTYNKKGEKVHRYHSFQRRHDQINLHSQLYGYQGQFPVDWRFDHNYIAPNHGDNYHNVKGSVQYTGNRFIAFYNSRLNDIADGRQWRQTLTVRNSLAWAEGEWAFGLPIENSFALVKGGKGLEDIDLAVASGSRELQATPRMPAVVPGLRSYHVGRVLVSADNPLYEIDDQLYELFPSYKSGFLLVSQLDSEALGTAWMTGYLLDDTGAPLELTTLRIFSVESPDAEPIISFSNSQGFVRLVGLQWGQNYIIEAKVPRSGTRGHILHYEIKTPPEPSLEPEPFKMTPTKIEEIPLDTIFVEEEQEPEEQEQKYQSRTRLMQAQVLHLLQRQQRMVNRNQLFLQGRKRDARYRLHQHRVAYPHPY